MDTRPLTFDLNDDDDDDDDVSPLEKMDVSAPSKSTSKPNRITRRRDTVCEVIESNQSSDSNGHIKIKISRFCVDSQPKVRNNLIDSDGEDDDDPIVNEPSNKRPCPKSKQSPASETTTTKDQIANLPMCSIILEKVDESKEMQRITRSSKRRAEILNSSDGSESNEKNSVDDDSSSEPKRQKTDEIPKNVNKAITIKYKKCAICNKSIKHSTSHYVSFHEGCEIYSARMSANVSDTLRRNPPKPAEFESGKISAHCYYCDKNLKLERNKWIDHFIRHTGEYTRQCKGCGTTVTQSTKKTNLCLHPDLKLVPMVDFNDTLYVYMCNFCNFTQSLEESMKNHIRNMHDIKLNIASGYTKFDLIPNLRRKVQVPQAADTESETNAENLKNSDVFKSSDQDEEVLTEAYKVMKENTFNSSAASPVRAANIPTSMADRLSERFKKQQQNAVMVKEESVDTHSVIYRSIEETVGANDKTGNEDESICNNEANKSNANSSTSQADADDQGEWESCSESEDDEEEDELLSKMSNNLNRLIMNKGKQTKGRPRTKKRDKRSSLMTMIKKEKNDEIVDFDADKAQIRPILSDMKRVDNMGLSMLLGTQKFHCNIGNCDFVSINNSSSLSNHLRQKHNEPWTGYCHACDKQILNGKFSLMKEFEHLSSHHVPSSTTVMKHSAKVAEPEKEPAGIETPFLKPAEPPRPRPLITVRRLSGDCLSKDPLQNITPQPPQPPLPPQQSTSFIPNATAEFETQPNPNNPIDDNDNPLKPWTRCMNTKNPYAEMKLKRECSLVALFKCMAFDCIFTTSDDKSMLKHLENHEELPMQEGSIVQDDISWLECCYCENVIDTCDTLVKHIVNVHSTSIFQCAYCFYRSVDQNNVSSHLERYHGNEQEKYILVCDSESISLDDDIKVLQTMATNVNKIQCSTAAGKLSFIRLCDGVFRISFNL